MKPKLVDYAVIGISMAITLAAGIGIGTFLKSGPRSGARADQQAPQVLRDATSMADWEERMLHRLEERLQLTPLQRQKVARELRSTRLQLEADRRLALTRYREELKSFFQRLDEVMADAQRPSLASEAENLERHLQP